MAEEKKSLLQKIREVPLIAEVREKLKNDRLKQKEKKFNEPAILEEDYVDKIDNLQGSTAAETDRLLQIFNKDTPLLKNILIQFLKVIL